MLPAVPPSLPPVSAFLAAHPRYAVLPQPYFEAGTSRSSFLDVDLKPEAFLGAGHLWSVELDAGSVHRSVQSSAPRCTFFLGFEPRDKVELRLFDAERQLRARFTLPIRPQRFTSLYQVGPYTRQVSRAWGEDGLSMVVIQGQYKPDFERLKQPVVYVGGDFNYQRIENLVKYFRTHGVDAYGYKPDYDRDPGESLLQMGQRDALDVDQLVGGRKAHLVGLCLGGILARAMASRHDFASVTTVGTPHTGSRLADVYNGIPALPMLHRFVTGDPRIHKYKDAHTDMVAFNAACDVKFRGVVLDAHDRPLDRRYDVTVTALRCLEGANVHTDGLILSEGQAFGKPLAVWNTDHAGMINDGLAGTYFDAYAAHAKLLEGLE
jgi:pimeloyl-ACP methyl ester carboxylesterase